MLNRKGCWCFTWCFTYYRCFEHWIQTLCRRVSHHIKYIHLKKGAPDNVGTLLSSLPHSVFYPYVGTCIGERINQWSEKGWRSSLKYSRYSQKKSFKSGRVKTSNYITCILASRFYENVKFHFVQRFLYVHCVTVKATRKCRPVEQISRVFGD